MRFSLNYEEDEDKSISIKNQDEIQQEIEKEKLIHKKPSKK